MSLQHRASLLLTPLRLPTPVVRLAPVVEPR